MKPKLSNNNNNFSLFLEILRNNIQVFIIIINIIISHKQILSFLLLILIAYLLLTIIGNYFSILITELSLTKYQLPLPSLVEQLVSTNSVPQALTDTVELG